jgi:hypothetical protein
MLLESIDIRMFETSIYLKITIYGIIARIYLENTKGRVYLVSSSPETYTSRNISPIRLYLISPRTVVKHFVMCSISILLLPRNILEYRNRNPR